MNPDELWKVLHNHLSTSDAVRVSFRKSDGSIRKMVCTQNSDLIEYDYKSESNASKSNSLNGSSVKVWDLVINEWRCIPKHTLISVHTRSPYTPHLKMSEIVDND